MRASSEVEIWVDTLALIRQGAKVFRSHNNVILTAGLPDRNSVPPSFVLRVFDKKRQTNIDISGITRGATQPATTKSKEVEQACPHLQPRSTSNAAHEKHDQAHSSEDFKWVDIESKVDCGDGLVATFVQVDLLANGVSNKQSVGNEICLLDVAMVKKPRTNSDIDASKRGAAQPAIGMSADREKTDLEMQSGSNSPEAHRHEHLEHPSGTSGFAEFESEVDWGDDPDATTIQLDTSANSDSDEQGALNETRMHDDALARVNALRARALKGRVASTCLSEAEIHDIENDLKREFESREQQQLLEAAALDAGISGNRRRHERRLRPGVSS